MRLHSAQGLHLFAVAPEIDTVYKAFKNGFSSYSDLLRMGFDNDVYGQDYASENSFSGMVPVMYNVLFSGTPKAMRRFYPDVEDGLVSRVCFVTLPDQFGKKMPLWGELDSKQRAIVGQGLVRLNDISILGDEVQPDHIMKMDWLNKAIEEWILKQQATAVQNDDRTRDIFCRRAAVVGFRAGMLAWFLYNERCTPPIRKNVVKFATWVAEHMLNQHLMRFTIKGVNSNTNQFQKVYDALPNEFTRDELQRALVANGYDTRLSVVTYYWRLAGLIEVIENCKSPGKKQQMKFRKTIK